MQTEALEMPRLTTSKTDYDIYTDRELFFNTLLSSNHILFCSFKAQPDKGGKDNRPPMRREETACAMNPMIQDQSHKCGIGRI